MLTEELLPLRIKDGRAIVGYLDDGDDTWVRALIDELERHVGRPKRELRQRLGEPLPVPSPYPQRRAAIAVLARLWRSKVEASRPPRDLRRIIFSERAAHGVRAPRFSNESPTGPASHASSCFASGSTRIGFTVAAASIQSRRGQRPVCAALRIRQYAPDATLDLRDPSVLGVDVSRSVEARDQLERDLGGFLISEIQSFAEHLLGASAHGSEDTGKSEIIARTQPAVASAEE